MKSQTVIILILCILLQTACDSDTEYFSIKNDVSISPVKITGNMNANVYIIYLTTPFYAHLDGQEQLLDELERNYGVVYYSFTRCESIGENCNNTKFNYKQLVEDIDLLFRVLKEKYLEGKSIFLLGYGLGANLILKYADVGLYKNELKGIILNGAAYNLRNTIKASKIKFTELMKNELKYGDYEGVQSFLEKLNAVDINTISPSKYYQLIDEQIEDHIQDSSDGIIYYWTELNFNCSYAHFLNAFALRLLGDYNEDLTPHIKNINLLYDLLETPDKELHIFDSICTLFENDNTSGELEDAAEIRAYSEKIIDFVEKYE